MSNTIHSALVAACLPVITSYHDDLLKHDKNELERYTGAFLHFAGENGTHLARLASVDELPAAGEFVPYIFSQAGRRHIVEGTVTYVAAVIKNPMWSAIAHYYDGVKLRKITNDRALEIAKSYTYTMIAKFDKERKLAA